MSKEVGGLDRVTANERLFLRLAKDPRNRSAELFACECTRSSCRQRIGLTLVEYEPVRSSPARYIVCPEEGHVDPALERVVEQQVLYWVVERDPSVGMIDFYGAREHAVATDLRALAQDERRDTRDPSRPHADPPRSGSM